MSGSAGAEADDYQDWIEQQQRGGGALSGPSPFDALQDTPAPAPAYGIPTLSPPSRDGGYVPRTAHGADVMAGLRARQEQQTARPGLDPNAQSVAVGAPPTPKEQGSLKDFGDQVWSSTLDMGQDAISAASFAARQLGASPETVQYLEQQKAAVGKHIEATLQGMSPGAQKALHASIFNDGSPDAPTWGQAGYFKTAAATLASLVPQVALAVLPGGVAGKIATRIAGEAAGAVARTAATAGAFGITDAGSAYKAMIDEVDNASEKELMDSPVYRELRGQGMADIAARKQLIQAVAPTMVAGHFAAGAAAGSGAGTLLTKGAMGAAGRGALGRAGIGAAEGAAVMGGQAGADNALDQNAQQQLGGRADFDPTETAKAVAAGALGGAVLGAGAGVLHGKPTPKGIAPDIAAALAEALPETPKPPPAPTPSFDAAGQGNMFPAQTEMFPGQGEMGQAPPPGPARPDVTPGTDPAAQQTDLFDPANAPRPPTPVPTQATMDLQGSYAPGAPGVAGFHPPADPNAGMAQAAQPELAMRAPPPVADPRMPDAGQGELFRQPGAPTDQAQPPRAATPAPVAPPAPPPTPQAEPGLLSRRQLIAALTQAGQDPQLLAHARLGDLRAMHDAIGQRVLRPEAAPEAAPEQPTVTQQPGHEIPTVVETEPASQTATGVASSPAPPPPDSVSATPSAEAVGATPIEAKPTTPMPEGMTRTPHPDYPDDPAAGEFAYPINDAAGKPVGNIHGIILDGDERDARQIQITGAHLDPGQPSGKGLGLPAYKSVVDWALDNGYAVNSHSVVSPDAQRIYEALKRRGYDVAEGPKNNLGPDGSKIAMEGSTYTIRGKPPVEVKPEPAPVESTPAPAPPTPKLTKDQELRAAAAAKRAAAKAELATRLAKPGERLKGEGFVDTNTAEEPAAPVETQAPAKPATPERDPAAVLGDIRAAAIRAGNMNELPPAIRDKFVADITKLVSGATSEADAHTKIAAFGEAGRDVKLTGAKVSRAVVADRVLQLLHKGKGLDSAEAFRRETVRQGRGVSVRENEGVAGRADLEDKMAGTEHDAEEAAHAVNAAVREDKATEVRLDHARGEEPISDGVTNYGDAAEKEYAASTTDLERKGNLLVNKLDQGLIDAADAHAAFPRYEKDPATGKFPPGRPPRWRNFQEFIDHQLASAPARQAKLEADLQTINNDKTLTPQKRTAETKRISRELAFTDEEHLEKLRAVQAETADPVGYAAAREVIRNAADEILAEDKAHKAEQIAAQRAEERAAKKERENAHVPEPLSNKEEDRKARIAKMQAERAAAGLPLYRRAGPDGINPAASRFVRAVRDPVLNRALTDHLANAARLGQTPMLHDMLRMIAQHAGPDAQPLRDLATNLLRQAPNLEVRAADLENAHGYYQPGVDPHIGINPGSDSHAQTLVHEALHAVTQAHIERMLTHEPNHPQLEALRAIGRELGAQTPDNLHELHAELMTNPALQETAARQTASPEFRARMSELGFAPREQGRSVWRAFTDWVRRAIGLKGPASASEYTLLDHVMRPLQDIVDSAVRHNARDLPNDPVLRAQAEPLYRMAAGSFGKAKDDALRAVDPSRLGDSLRRGVLQGATTDSIHNWNKTLFEPSDRLAIGTNPLTRFRAASEAIARRAADFHAQFVDRVRGLAGQLKGRDDLNKLMTDATLGQAQLAPADPAKANLHLTTPEQRADLAALQARFAKLSPEDQATYRATRDHYAETYRQTRDAELKSLVSNALPDATQAQIAALTKVVRSKTTLDKFIKSGTDADLAAAFGKAWEDNRALVKGIAKVHALGFVQGDYFPLRRYGDYLIRYGSEGEGNYGVERFEKRSEADARYAELAQADTEDLSQVQTMGTSFLKAPSVDAPLVNELTHALRAKGADSEHIATVTDSLNRILLEHATHSERARLAMRRKGVAGASVDQARTLAREFLSTGSRIGHLEHGAERYKALSDMRLVSKDLARMGQRGEQIRAQAVTHELEQRVAVLEDQGGVLAAITRKAGAFGFIQSLMSPSHMITSSIEAHMNSTALLGARHGAGRATLALSRALAQVSPKLLKTGAANTLKAMGQGLKQADWDLSKVARDRLIAGGANAKAMTDLFARLDAAGLIDHTADAEMRRIANPSGVVSTTVGKYWQRFMDMNAAGAHAVDVANKAAIAKAAYDLEFRKTNNHATAADYAVEAVRQTTPNYNLANKARITTAKGALGAFAGPITQFKQYGIHMYGVMANLAKASVHGADRDARAEARKAFAGILATHALMAGGLTLIADPLRYIGGAYDAIFGPAGGKPHDYQNDVRGFLSDTFGPELGEVMARGVPHLAGIDIHRRVGLANLLEVPELKSFDMKGMGEMLATAVMGAAGEDAERLGLGALKLLHGDPSGVLDMVPRVVRDMGTAARRADRGVTDSKGKTILPASALSTADIARQAVGFQPSKVSEFREGRFAVQERASETKDAKQRLMDAWTAAAPADRAPVMARIREWNQDNRGQAITTDALLRKLASDRKQASQRPDNFGLRLPPKAAQSLRAAGRFAYQQ